MSLPRRRAISIAAVLLVAGAACTREPAPELEVAHRVLAVAPRPAAGDPVEWCELDSEVRPSIGCIPTFFGSVAEVAVERPAFRQRLDVPAAARGAPILVQSKLYFADDPAAKFLPGVAVAGAAAETIDVELPIQPEIPTGRARFEYRLRPIPAGEREYASGEIAIPPGAVLDVGMGLERIAEWVGAAPAEMEVVARDGATDTRLLRALLSPGGADVDRWIDHRVDLGPVAGRTVRLVLRSRAVAPPGGEADFVYAFPVWGAANVLVPARAGASVRRPNVVLISLDTLRADHLGAYGSSLPTSPEIDRFAAESTLFERAYTTWTSTLHSHMSLFTGRYPSGYGEISLTRRLSPEVPTLPELLGRAGYQTAAMTEDALLRGALGFWRGIDFYRENRSSGVTRAPGQADKTFADGLRWLARHRDERFFLFLHTYQVHAPYTPPAEFDRFRTWTDGGVERPIDATTPAAVRDQRLYAGEVLYTDAEMRKLLDGIAALGLAESTIVILTADHGEEFGEHGLQGHGKTLFWESTRVPLVVRAPGLVPAGLRVPVQVSLTDVLPTVLELTGVAAPHGVQGRSLVPLLADPAAAAFADRPVFSELRTELFDAFAVRDGAHTWMFNGIPTPRLVAFDLRVDPRETTPLRDPELLERGRRLRAEFDAQSAAIRPPAEAPGKSLQVEPPDAATAAKLRALGYTE